jgi:hypothetical protein
MSERETNAVEVFYRNNGGDPRKGLREGWHLEFPGTRVFHVRDGFHLTLCPSDVHSSGVTSSCSLCEYYEWGLLVRQDT